MNTDLLEDMEMLYLLNSCMIIQEIKLCRFSLQTCSAAWHLQEEVVQVTLSDACHLH